MSLKRNSFPRQEQRSFDECFVSKYKTRQHHMACKADMTSWRITFINHFLSAHFINETIKIYHNCAQQELLLVDRYSNSSNRIVMIGKFIDW